MGAVVRPGGEVRRAEGAEGVMVALDPPDVKHVPLAEATARTRTVPLNGDTILTARELGIFLGDEAVPPAISVEPA